MKRNLPLLLLSLSLFAYGCSDDTPDNGDGSVADTGGDNDAGGGQDAGGNTDSGGGQDAAPNDTGVADSGGNDAGPTDTGVGDTGVADTGMADAGLGDTGLGDTGTSTGTGACTNTADQTIITNGGEAALTEATQSCFFSCILDQNRPVCVATCVENDIGVSQGCALCFADRVECVAANCLGDCTADPSAQACVDCQVQNGCVSAFETCSGL